MAPFPLVKLAIVFFKQVSKPLANQIKVRAKNSEFFKKYICMPPAQFYHWYDVNLRMRMLGIETKKVAKMNEEAAVALGADILGEAVILAVAIAGLALEYARRSKNDSDKEARQLERLTNLEKQISEFEIVLTNHSANLLQLERLIHHHLTPPSSPKGEEKHNKPSPSSSPSPATTTTTTTKAIATAPSPKQAGQSFSIVDTTSLQSPLIQMHPTDILFRSTQSTIENMNYFFHKKLQQWYSWRNTKN